MQDKLTSAAGAGGTHRWPARWAARLARHGVRRALFSVARPQSQSPLARAIFCLPLSRAHCLLFASFSWHARLHARPRFCRLPAPILWGRTVTRRSGHYVRARASIGTCIPRETAAGVVASVAPRGWRRRAPPTRPGAARPCRPSRGGAHSAGHGSMNKVLHPGPVTTPEWTSRAARGESAPRVLPSMGAATAV